MPTDAHHPSRVASALIMTCALIGVALLLAASALLASAPRAQAASTVSVEISNFAFQPASVTIQVGDTVTWTNLDSAAHTATDTGSGSLFDGVMNQGESLSYTFTQAGTFDYICTFHPDMTGTVIVQAASEPSASQVPDAAMSHPAPVSTPWAFGWAVSVLGSALLVFGLVAVRGAKRRDRA
jgi:plastocyanin